MRTLFADTFYFLALLNPHDDAHGAAEAASIDGETKLVTTAWVLTELADGLSETAGRRIFANLLADLCNDPQATVLPADQSLWRRGVELYAAREDKGWSLTDCISFVVMKEMGIDEALTADHHFKQAGFRTLLG